MTNIRKETLIECHTIVMFVKLIVIWMGILYNAGCFNLKKKNKKKLLHEKFIYI